MADNNFSAAVVDVISQKILEVTSKALVALKYFSIDCSDELKEKGTTVDVPIIGPATAKDVDSDYSGDFDAMCAANGETIVTKPVALSAHPAVGWHLKDSDLQELGKGIWTPFAQKLVITKAYALCAQILGDGFALITTANFGAAIQVAANAAFDEDVVGLIRGDCVDAGWNMQLEGAALLANGGVYTNLGQSPAIKDQSASGSTTLHTGMIPRLHNFDIVETPTLPTAENLNAIASRGDGLLFANRVIEPQMEGAYTFYEVLTDPVTGVKFAFAGWYKPGTRKMNFSLDCITGWGVGNAQGLKRIQSA